MSKQKQKGSAFEREVARTLTEHLDIGEFMRTPHSGAYIGGSNFHRASKMDKRLEQVFKGDVMPPEGYTLVIECKNYAAENFKGGLQNLIKGEHKTFEDWVSQVRHDAVTEEVELPHLLFFKLSRVGTFVAVSKSTPKLYKTIKDSDEICYTSYKYFFAEEESEEYLVIDFDWIEYLTEELREDIK
jgi:hypothetical protein